MVGWSSSGSRTAAPLGIGALSKSWELDAVGLGAILTQVPTFGEANSLALQRAR